MSDVSEEYEDDIRVFGFGPYGIDFSDLSKRKVRYICEAMRRYNQRFGGASESDIEDQLDELDDMDSRNTGNVD